MNRKRGLGIDVLTASRQRICNIFDNGLPVYLSFSGGKDGLVLSHVVMELIKEKRIDPSLLRVEFIDEEAIFPCVEEIVHDWRKRFIDAGATFLWYCVQVKHYSCLNMLENDESFILFDEDKRDVWVREPPDFAIRDHPALIPRSQWPVRRVGFTYQEFLARIKDGVHMTGVRAAESVQRKFFLARLPPNGISRSTGSVHPMYDWEDGDVWRYLLEHHVETPRVYQHLYQIGVGLSRLRISQFFSVDTCPVLARIAEFYPGLMERILKREPSAYLVSLYWDSEMFRRRSHTRRKIEQATDEPQVDNRKRLLELMANPPESLLRTKDAAMTLKQYRGMVLRYGHEMKDVDFRTAANALIAGDPKRRVMRALMTQISSSAHKQVVELCNAKRQAAPDPGTPAARHQRQAGRARSAHTE